MGWLIIAFLLSGCFGRGDDGPQEPEMLSTLPEDWVPVNDEKEGVWRRIDIDDDPGQYEFLIFFTYNNVPSDSAEPVNSGPAGALIFDLQNNSEFMPASNVLAMPYQPSGSYIPYRPLPNYWTGSSDGFVAPSGRHGGLTLAVATRVQENQTRVVASSPGGDSNAAEPGIQKVQELLVQDGGRTISVIWWRDNINGYGAASVYAAGGFEDLTFATSQDTTTPLRHFNGKHPFHDRSEICNVIRYEREYLTATLSSDVTGVTLDSPSPYDMHFKERPLGLDFCKNIGPIPFYPEAVVLKYLTAERPDERLTDFQGDTMEQTAIDLRNAVRGNSDGEASSLRILGIFGPQLILFQNRQVSRATVCVEFIDTSVSADVPESKRRSAATFRLRHEKPEVNYPSTDEFRIEGAERIPSPENGLVAPVDCNAFVEDGTPGRVSGP